MPLPITLDQVSKGWLTNQLEEIEAKVDKDVIVIIGSIIPQLDIIVRMALEHMGKRRKSSLVILDTPGGFVEMAERIASTLRHFHKTVDFLIPNEAMSAGTVLALSGDVLWMDYFSRLGPIDPQLERDGRMIPGLSYLRQYESLIEKSAQGSLTETELTLLDKLDLAELHQIDLAAKLSVSLIRKWLVEYRFGHWKDQNGKPVSKKIKQERAAEIAAALGNHQRWGTHARGIQKDVLENELGLKTDDFGKVPGLKTLVWEHFWTVRELVQKNQLNYFVQSRGLI